MFGWPLIFIITLLAPGGAFEPSPPGNQSKTKPTSQPADTLKSWLTDLAAENADARRAARVNLLNISRADLMTIRTLIAAGAARQPAQKQALTDIVCHVFLATEPYETAPGESFFGLFKYRPVAVGERMGLIFESRLIGFPAYASLEDGDIILAVEEMPEIDFTSNNPLVVVRKNFAPGETIHLRVLRDDRVLAVSLKLAAAPSWTGQGMDERLIREQQATEFWRTAFEPLWAPKAE